MSKIYSGAEIRAKLQSSDRWVYRGLVALHARQTADERQDGTTKYQNGVGFNGRDAAFLSSLATQVRVWEAQANPRYPQPLSAKQLESARRSILKYSNQLANIANENSAEEDGDARAERDAIMQEQEEGGINCVADLMGSLARSSAFVA